MYFFLRLGPVCTILKPIYVVILWTLSGSYTVDKEAPSATRVDEKKKIPKEPSRQKEKKEEKRKANG